MRGEISSGRHDKRHPLDWYVESGWEWFQIAQAIGLDVELADGCTIWDPAAGYGKLAASLHDLSGSACRYLLTDLVDNVDWLSFDYYRDRVTFRSLDFFFDSGNSTVSDRAFVPPSPCSIWSNPPFSYTKINGEIISQAYARQALKLATHRVVFLLPLKWLAGQARGQFLHEHPPQTVLIFAQRPSMPPGDRIALMGNRAHSGGMTDYCAIVWDVRTPTAPGDTRTIWLPPLGGRR